MFLKVRSPSSVNYKLKWVTGKSAERGPIQGPFTNSTSSGSSRRRHLGSIWEFSGKHLGWFWKSFGSHLEVIWTSFGSDLRARPPRGPRRLQEAPNLKNRCPSQLKCKSSIKMSILHCVFEGQITKYRKLQTKMLPGSR